LGGGEPPLRLDLCTDFGPPDEDKSCNQDAAAFAALPEPWGGVVVALADGVSNSPYSEFGARLAVRTLVELVPQSLRAAGAQDGLSPVWWQGCFERAAEAVRRQMALLWERIEAAPGDFVPPGWRPEIFARAVREKNLFLTTLVAAVVLRENEERCWGFFAHVGDGSLSFCRASQGQSQFVDALVCDAGTTLDHSLGPAVERTCFPRCSYARLGREFHLGLATDGVARAFPMKDLLLRVQQEGRGEGAPNAARHLIEGFKRDCPERVADNLSLAFLSGGRPTPSPGGTAE